MIRHLLAWLSRDSSSDLRVSTAWIGNQERLEMRQTREFPRWKSPKEIADMNEASELQAVPQ